MNERPEDVSPYILESNMLNSLRLIFTKYKTKSEDFPGLWVEIAKMKIALLLANLNTIKATSIRQILSPLVSDLKRLEDRGLFIRERGITIKVRLAFVIGDNLGVSELFCGATYREYKDHSVISKPLNIHTINYSEARLNPGKYGIMRSSEFFKLNCNLFTLAPPDLFHDIQEGILTDVVQSILIGMKVKKRELRRKIKSIRWVNYAFFCRLVELFPTLMNDQNEASRAYRNFLYMIFSIYG
ncbi:hypothetical protein DERF_006320 [Dermatophagoides farinae]|uniref:Uncharacterized protein n=1 Tax=Dermatophagoides farinae TaxID=6954 RepID=A0A922L716_DERFA|nr:hypothetical protein DERF_006320 [Dermatophagoides farinae]